MKIETRMIHAGYNLLPVLHGDLRTWVLVSDWNKALVLEKCRNKMEVVDRIYSSQSRGQTSYCTVNYKRDVLLRYNPGLYKKMSSQEPLDFTHKVSARLDEAVWNGRFDHILLVASQCVLKELDCVLSDPVRARVIGTVVN